MLHKKKIFRVKTKYKLMSLPVCVEYSVKIPQLYTIQGGYIIIIINIILWCAKGYILSVYVVVN